MNNRVLLTGGTGFIGRQAVAALQDAGFEVHALGRHEIAGIRWHQVNLLDASMVAAVIPKICASHLLHLAWEVTHGRFWSAQENLDWVAASLKLYRAFAEGGGRRIVVAGSCAEYDWTTGLLEETGTPLRPISLYGTAKHALHQVLISAAPAMGIELAWGRIFFLYGPHEGRARLVPSVIIALLKNENVLVTEGKAERDFMHVKDVARALVRVLDTEFVGAVNIASGETRPMREVVAAIAGQIGRPQLVQFGARPTPVGEAAVLGTSARILREIGFAPQFSLETGLADTIAWWRAALPLQSRQCAHD